MKALLYREFSLVYVKHVGVIYIRHSHIIVFNQLAKSLKAGGVWYFSFKYGNEERVKDGRTFTDMNEESISILLSQLPTLVEESVWLTLDARPDRDEKWLNVIVRKF